MLLFSFNSESSKNFGKKSHKLRIKLLTPTMSSPSRTKTQNLGIIRNQRSYLDRDLITDFNLESFVSYGMTG